MKPNETGLLVSEGIGWVLFIGAMTIPYWIMVAIGTYIGVIGCK